MENGKSVSELGMEYKAQAKDLQAQIDALKKQPWSYKTGKRILILQEMQRDLEMNAKHLKAYYEKSPKKRVYHKSNAYKKERK